MAASVQVSSDRFRLLRPVRSQPRVRAASSVPTRTYEPHAFPHANTPPSLSESIPDEMLEHYAFIFCQGGFHKLGMTFEQFLLVAETIKPYDVEDSRENGWIR